MTRKKAIICEFIIYMMYTNYWICFGLERSVAVLSQFAVMMMVLMDFVGSDPVVADLPIRFLF